MKHIYISFLVSAFIHGIFAQTHISGILQDESGLPIIGANIYFLDTYEGTTSDTSGNFNLTTTLGGEKTFMVQCLGYETYSDVLSLEEKKITLHIQLKESAANIDEVQITAGTFSAGDKKTSVMLSSMDIAMSASALGDINAAMSSLPGAQFVGEEGGLFVRGGDQYETKTFIDGLRVERPFTSKQPDLPVRSRFSPLLFSGTMFSTGGFSAEYGDALSGALILTSNAFPEKDQADISIHSAGVGFNLAKKYENTAFSSNTGYYNMAPYLSIAPEKTDWHKEPRTLEQTFTFMQRAGKQGLIKSMITMSDNQSSMWHSIFPDKEQRLISMHNRNVFFKTTYNTMLNEKWMIHSGIGLTYDTDNTDLGRDVLSKKLDAQQIKTNFRYFMNPVIDIKAGGELISRNFIQAYYLAEQEITYPWEVEGKEYATYLEGNIQLSNSLALRVGSRLEYTDIIEQVKVVPRASMAIKTGEKSQISLAYGIYNQKPTEDLFIYDQTTGYETSHQYIANYQVKNGKRTIRAEAYYKQYTNLITFDYSEYTIPENQNNNGHGYATGLDVFYRDKETIKNGDFWVSWSFINSKRLYRDLPELRTPSYISTHNISFVHKQYLESVRSFVGCSYKFTSPRVYYHPVSPDKEYKTKSYNEFSVNALKIVPVGKTYGAIHLVINNVFGFQNEYGYRFSTAGDNNETDSTKITPPAIRFFLLGFILMIQ
ncbi:MAG: TonB-dependent receptor [Bacteroidota bacterium]